MNKANECTCPSGDGSLVHPCPAHPAVEQAGGDERAVDGKPRATKCPDCGEGDLMPGDLCACGYETDPAAGYACSECDGSGDGYVGEVCRECDGSGWFVTPEQARAALAQPSGEVVVTKNESGAIVSVTRQDKEGRVLSVIAESATLTAQAEKAEVERPEVVAWQYRVTAGPQTGWSLWHPGKGEEFERSYTVERRPLMTVAQHERIVGELRAVIAQLRQHKNDYMDSGQETYRALQNEIREREAEIARLDGLVSVRTAERDAALARVEQQERTIAGMNEAHAKLADLYEAAQTQHSVPVAREQLERLVRILDAHNYAKDAEALMALLAAAPAQAQHSVPEGWKPVPIEPLLNMMSDKDHDTRITAERQLLSILAAAPGNSVPQAWLDVQAERRRQITAEGWTPEHDDLYCAAELPRAAAAYILNGANDEAPAIWPFSAKWWKPRDARANYVRAAALILAEIERLDRAGISQSPQPGATTASS
ncbi:hypothetical protein P3792_27790 [Pseudomonas aeruginosa]|uniref:hypothetical protein n=2 Tax=Pseudomonas aeruginosa TaxID=287 RepID=UPI002358A2DE|nr:hypothetical protein [Pseudomonas aeruginosa]